MSLTAVAAIPRDTTANHALVVTYTSMIGTHETLPATIVRNLLREIIEDPA